MESGKHVVIEKPIAITLEDAKIIVETSRRTGKKAMMGFNMRYREGYRKLKEIVDRAGWAKFCITGASAWKWCGRKAIGGQTRSS